MARVSRSYGSLLVAGGIALASVKAAMAHSRITTSSLAVITSGT